MTEERQTDAETDDPMTSTTDGPSSDEKTEVIRKLSTLTSGAAVAAVLVDSSTNPALAS
jgi:hypothetical protein